MCTGTAPTYRVCQRVSLTICCTLLMFILFLSYLANMHNAVIKKYACTHDELLTDRISYVADDIETFVSSALKSPAATMFVFIWFPPFLFFLCFSLQISSDRKHFHRQEQRKKKRQNLPKRSGTNKRNLTLNWTKTHTDAQPPMISFPTHSALRNLS